MSLDEDIATSTVPGLVARVRAQVWDEDRADRAVVVTPELRLLVIAALAAGVLLRFLPAGPLWFDEAQSVGIARLPVPQLFAALRQDGSPPLYYLILHVWMLAFGRGTFAVRSLSGVFSVATIPVFAALARRLLPRRGQLPAVLLFISSPFDIRFADEARMYSLVILLVAAGGLLLCRALEEPVARRLVPLGIVSAMLGLTHYWGLFLLAVVGAGLAWHAFRRGSLPARRALVAIVFGGALFVPWIPSLLFQVANTGTPWQHAGPLDSTVALAAWAGALNVSGALIVAVPLVGLLFCLVAGACISSEAARRLAVVAGATVALAGTSSYVLGAAVVPRYTSIGLLPYLLAAGAGAAYVARPWLRRMLAVAVVLGFVTGVVDATAPRTLAGTAAQILTSDGSPADTVVYCPDQLGPDVSRLLPGWYQQEMYPTGAFPDRVDWVDYAQRNYQSSAQVFAERVAALVPNQPIWLLEASNFTSYGARCQRLAGDLTTLRPDPVAHPLGADPMNPSQQEYLVEYLPRRL